MQSTKGIHFETTFPYSAKKLKLCEKDLQNYSEGQEQDSSQENDSFNLNITTTSSEESDPNKYVIFYGPIECCFKLGEDLWETMYIKDCTLLHHRNPHMMWRHIGLIVRHRAVLLDWLMDVSDLYNLSRSTYHLAADYLGRFLSATTHIKRGQLQLIGITCLHIACKVEEVNPVLLNDLLYLTDNLYTIEEMLEMEIYIVEVIDWRLCVWTANTWLFAFLHLANRILHQTQYIHMTNLIDLVLLDNRSLQFSYSILAASCFQLVTSSTVRFPIQASQRHLEICECVSWMKIFWDEMNNESIKHLPKLSSSMNKHKCQLAAYSIDQQHTNLLEIYDRILHNENNCEENQE